LPSHDGLLSEKNKNKTPHYLMNTHKTRLAVALALAGTAAVAGAQVYTNVDAYAMPTWHSPYAVEPILSAADQVPRTSNPQTSFQMVGIPDGLGIYQTSQFTARILMNHEFSATALSRPIIGESRVKGAFVSSFLIDRQRRGVVSGDLAFTDVFVESAYFGPIAREDNASREPSTHGVDPRWRYSMAKPTSSPAWVTFHGRISFPCRASIPVSTPTKPSSC
jgi:hypothetical protein